MNRSPVTDADAAAIGVLERLLYARHSCRAFLGRPVERHVIERILALAQRTASWCNAQPWQVTVVSGEPIERFRTALTDATTDGEGASGSNDFEFPSEYRGVYLDRRRECGFQLYDAVGVKRGDREAYAKQTLENFRLFGAPHVAIITSDPDLGVYGAIDVGGYVQVLLLAMQAHGVAAIPQAALARHSALVKSLLGIPAERKMVCGVSFGYEDVAHPANSYRTSRARLDEAVRWVG